MLEEKETQTAQPEEAREEVSIEPEVNIESLRAELEQAKQQATEAQKWRKDYESLSRKHQKDVEEGRIMSSVTDKLLDRIDDIELSIASMMKAQSYEDVDITELKKTREQERQERSKQRVELQSKKVQEEAALNIATKLTQVNMPNNDPLLKRAVTAWEKGDYERAEGFVEDAIELFKERVKLGNDGTKAAEEAARKKKEREDAKARGELDVPSGTPSGAFSDRDKKIRDAFIADPNNANAAQAYYEWRAKKGI